MRARAVVRRMTVATTLFAVLVVAFSTVGLGLLSVPFGASAKPSIRPSSGLPNSVGSAATTSPHNLSWVTPSLMRALAMGELPPSERSQFSAVPDSVWAEAAHQVNPSVRLSPLGFPSQSTLGFGLGISAVVVGAVCIATGVETFGLGCVAILAAIAIGLALNYLFNTNVFVPTTGIAWQTVANNMLLGTYQRFVQQADDLGQLLSAANLTQYAMAYEAAAAALAQIGNASFSTALDLQQSSVALQLMGVIYQDEWELGQAYAQALAAANVVMGSQNSAGTFCYLTETGGEFNGVSQTLTAPSGTSGTPAVGGCPLTGSPTAYAYGMIEPAIAYTPTTLATPTSCPPVFLFHSEVVSAFSGATGSNGITFIPVDAVTLARNTTINWTGKFSATSTNVTFNGSTQAYYVCSSFFANTITFLPSQSFPLNAAISGVEPEFTYISSSASGSENPSTAQVLSGDLCSGTSGNCGGFLGDSTGAVMGTHSTRGEQVTMVNDLFQIANYAGTVGQTYWGFLRTLGYTSVSQIPSNCIIPTPNVAIPPNWNPANLPTNATALEQAYIGYLGELAATFNSSSALTSLTFCGHHVSWTATQGTFPLGAYAYGWIYVPTATHTSTGSGSQVFGTPSTWNRSGFIYLSPNAASLTVTLNTTWLLSNASFNTEVLFAQPFLNGSWNKPTVNANGPTQCLAVRAYTPNGCNTTAGKFWESGLTAGNSTFPEPNGSAYPAGKGTTAGIAVYLTFCIQVSPSSTPLNPVFVVHPTTCQFTYQTINVITTSSSGGVGGITVPLNGACGSGSTFLWSTLVTAFASVTGTSSIGCLAADALAAIALAIIVVVAVIVVVAIVRRD